MKNIIAHLRIPFSAFLLPVFLFALSQTGLAADGATSRAWWAFFIIHLLLYPASNAFNSYYDKDEGSIGILERPPPVSIGLLVAAWMLDMAAITVAWWSELGTLFISYLLVYGLISKVYSHPSIRLKKFPLASWVIVGLFQGALTYLATVQVISQGDVSSLLSVKALLPAFICTSNLWAVYPLTQVYQHEEDARRGDLTYSRMVGTYGTFLNAAVFFTLSFAGFVYYFLHLGAESSLIALALCVGPVLGYFGYWWMLVRRNATAADFRHTMRMSVLASLGLNLFFGILCFSGV